VSEQTGEKTEQPSARRLEDAKNRGQIARSPEVQTAFVLLAMLGAFSFTGRELWQTLAMTLSGSLSHLHDTPLSINAMPGYALHAALLFLRCTGPIVLAAMLGGLLAGGVQNRFNSAPEALGIQWERLSPVTGFQRVFSTRSTMAAAVALLKFILVFSLTFSVVKQVLNDPVFTSSVSLQRFMEFLASSCLKICLRILLAMGVIASADYGYQYWQNNRDLMMTKQEVKDEMKNTEGNPQIKKARQRRMRGRSKRAMLAEVPKADVVVTNPTHYAVALRYDRKTMQAPRLVAKGIRKNALEIREIAQEAGVPIVENKPLARLMFKYGKVGQEIPSQLYVAVAEVLAYVYRTNPYRYYAASCADSAPNQN
jgi:flagellar biosynthesis protein FlhB